MAKRHKIFDTSVKTLDEAFSLIADFKQEYPECRYEISNFVIFGVEFIQVKVYE